MIEDSFHIKRGSWKSPHPYIAAVSAFIRPDEMLIDLGRQTKALHRIN